MFELASKLARSHCGKTGRDIVGVVVLGGRRRIMIVELDSILRSDGCGIYRRIERRRIRSKSKFFFTASVIIVLSRDAGVALSPVRPLMLRDTSQEHDEVCGSICSR